MDVLQPPNPVQSSLHAAPPQSENSDGTNMQIDSLPPPAQETSDDQDAPVDEQPPAVEQAPVAQPVLLEIPPPAPPETVEPEGVKTNTTPPPPVEPSDLMVAQPETLAPPLSEAPVESLKTTPSHDRDEEEERPAKRARLGVDAASGEGSADAPPDVASDPPITNGVTETAPNPPVEESLDEIMAEAPDTAPAELAPPDTTSAPAASATEDTGMGNGVDEAPTKDTEAEPAALVDPVAPAAHESNNTNETLAPDVAVPATSTTADTPANGDLTVNTAPAAESGEGGLAETPATPAPEVPKSFDSSKLSKQQKKFLVEQIRKMKKVKNSAPYLTPVDAVGLNLQGYHDIVEHPMDISTIEAKLKGDQYNSVDECVADVYLMVHNAKLYNGAMHPVYLAGANLLSYVIKCLALLPKNGEEPPEDPKKAKKPAQEKRASLPRRETRPPPAPPTPVAGAASSPTTYALQPGGVPIIRRDSTVDGRPKREIHRPPSKDLPYNNARPRKKKYQLELKFCEHVLKNLLHTRNYDAVHPFYKPVDPVALNIPTYHSVIKKPMDLETIEKKLKTAEYNTAKDFKDDVELMVKNCFKFNVTGDFVYERGQKTEALFKQLWEEKAEWMRENAPQSEPRSEEEDEEEEEEEEEEEPEENTADQSSRLDALQKQIAALHAEMTSIVASASAGTSGKKRASPVAATKKEKKGAKAGGTKKAKRSDGDLGTAKASKAAAAQKSKKDKKIPKLSQEQKKEVSDGIGMLDDQGMRKAVQIIRNGVPALRDVNDDELELDIDEIPDAVVYDLYKFVQSLKPTKSKSSASAVVAREPDDAGAYDEPEDDDYNPPARQRAGNAGVGGRKKNKPMGAAEQERKIAEIKAKLEGFKEGGTAGGATGSGSSARDSEDDDDESESEEE